MSSAQAVRDKHAIWRDQRDAARRQVIAVMDQARERIGRSITLLDRTRRSPWAGPSGSDAVLIPPLTVTVAGQPLVLESIGDLINFIQRRSGRWAPLRAEAFVAASLPSPARMTALRSLALATLRGSGIEVR
jgi:predicted aminopeptidase